MATCSVLSSAAVVTFGDQRLSGGEFHNGFWLVAEELIHSQPTTRAGQVPIVVEKQRAPWHHPRIEVDEAIPSGLIEIQVDMHEPIGPRGHLGEAGRDPALDQFAKRKVA